MELKMNKINSILIKNKNKKKEEEKKATTFGLFKFFVIFFFLCLCINIILAVMTGGDSWKLQMFHSNGYTDMFMDFFNSVRDGGSSNVYTERNNIYPPLCVLIFRIISKLIKPNLVSTPFNLRTLLQYDQICILIYFAFAIICIVGLTRLVEAYVKLKQNGKFKLEASILSYMMIVSFPVMFCIERGNILILSVVLSMFFCFFKDSSTPIVREISYIALAIAAGIKLYPAIFGLTLIIEKKYKEAFRTILYGIIIVVGPIVFFIEDFKNSGSTAAAISPLLQINSMPLDDTGTPSAIMKIINNLISFATKKKSSLNFSSVSIQNFIFMLRLDNGSTIAKIVCAVTEVIALISAFVTKSEWKKIFLISYLMLNIPSASSSYALSFLIIPFFIFLFGTTDRKYSDKFHIVCFSLLLTPLPMFWYYYQDTAKAFVKSLGIGYNTHLNQYLGTLVFQLMFLMIVIEIIYDIVEKKKNIKKEHILAQSEKSDNTTNTEEQ